MNDTQFVEAARYLAQRAMRDAGAEFDQRLDFITTRLLARELGPGERAVARRTYREFVEHYGSNTREAGKLLATGESAPDEALPSAESAAWSHSGSRRST